LFRRDRYHEKWALRDVTLRIPEGQCFGIIGRNGAGKSTLLKLLTGVLRPTIGTMRVKGRALGLLEVGTGFHPEFTGRQNVITSARLLGFPPEYTRERMGEIESFADIGEFFDMPIKLYSSGMFARLAFSMYLYMEPEVFIIDEALSVGDAFFQQKCARAITRMRENGATMLFVTHDLATVRSLCDRVLWLEGGHVAAVGWPEDVVRRYAEGAANGVRVTTPLVAKSVSAAISMDRAEVEKLISEVVANSPDSAEDKTSSWEITGARIVSSNSEPTVTARIGEHVTVQVVLRGQHGNRAPMILAALVDRLDRTITSMRANLEPATVVKKRDYVELLVLVDMQLAVTPGEYTVLLEVIEGKDTSRIPAAVRIGPLTVYWDQLWMPFFSLVGLPTHFAIEGRLVSTQKTGGGRAEVPGEVT
jgi:ABC-type polysaccharide/polyol phosphate transport system ATPase subunit